MIIGGPEAKLGLGSVAAGGRYDNLIGMFSKHPIPSAGGSLGIERIFNILESRASNELVNPIDVMIGTIGTVSRDHVLKVASWLWGVGCKTEIFYEEHQKVGEQIKIAANKGARHLILIGEDELPDNKLVVRDLLEKHQTKVDYDQDSILRQVLKER